MTISPQKKNDDHEKKRKKSKSCALSDVIRTIRADDDIPAWDFIYIDLNIQQRTTKNRSFSSDLSR